MSSEKVMELPQGWKKVEKIRNKGKRIDVYIFSPDGKRFRSRSQLKIFFDRNPNLGLSETQFSFKPTKGMRQKLKENTCVEKKSITTVSGPPVVSILPSSQLVIKVFDHPTVIDIDPVPNDANGEVTVVKESKNMKSLIKDTALKTLLQNVNNEKVIQENQYIDPDMDWLFPTKSKGKLTQLEELDLYYDFNYKRDEILSFRNVFDDDNKDAFCDENF